MDIILHDIIVFELILSFANLFSHPEIGFESIV